MAVSPLARWCRPERLRTRKRPAALLDIMTTARTAMSMPRLRSIGFMPAATALPPCARSPAPALVVVVPSPAVLVSGRRLRASAPCSRTCPRVRFNKTVTPSAAMRERRSSSRSRRCGLRAEHSPLPHYGEHRRRAACGHARSKFDFFGSHVGLLLENDGYGLCRVVNSLLPGKSTKCVFVLGDPAIHRLRETLPKRMDARVT